MKYIKSIFAVSIVAMAVVGNARASIVSQTNIVGGSNVSVEVPASGTKAGKVVISATDTTYTTGTTTYSGTTKLYTGTGSETDGTLTQKAITTALNGKLSTTGTAAKATADASGNTITTTYATKTELGGKQDKLGYTAENAENKVVSGSNMQKILDGADADSKYPTVKAALGIAQIAAGAATANYGELANHDTVSADLIDNDAVTSEKILNGAIEEEDLSDAVKTKLTATVQTVDPAAGKYVTNVTKDGTTIKAETAYVQIPVGSATASKGVASIWVE